jgi:hypothetical protein
LANRRHSISHLIFISQVQENEILSSEDAYWFPVIGSIVLFSFYLLFTLFSKEMVNLLITAYFALFGTAALVRLLSPPLRKAIHGIAKFEIKQKPEGEKEKEGEKGEKGKKGEKEEKEEKEEEGPVETWCSTLLTPLEFNIHRHAKGMPISSFFICIL